MKNGVITFTVPFGIKNFGDWTMIVNIIRSMTYPNIVLFSYGSVFNQEIVYRYLGNYNIKLVEVILDDFVEKSHFLHTPVEILDRVKNLDVVKEYFPGVDKLVLNGRGYLMMSGLRDG
ncbi:hypothetical protein ACRCJN_07630 [Aerococcus urinaeequi]|uniref:hypothetical protein n=1 Tax=Aerococcus urinaeequi TaxID=51665 RepID=UPI003D6A70F1